MEKILIIICVFFYSKVNTYPMYNNFNPEVVKEVSIDTINVVTKKIVYPHDNEKLKSYCKKFINENYKKAVDIQNQYGIPASISLAQAILESGWGKSFFYREGNNAFGIKTWNPAHSIKGKSNRMFKKFRTIEDCWDYRTKMFISMNRYKDLPGLNGLDYKKWAYSLRDRGYCRSKTYPHKLIKLIKMYKLFLYDNKTKKICTTLSKQQKA